MTTTTSSVHTKNDLHLLALWDKDLICFLVSSCLTRCYMHCSVWLCLFGYCWSSFYEEASLSYSKYHMEKLEAVSETKLLQTKLKWRKKIFLEKKIKKQTKIKSNTFVMTWTNLQCARKHASRYDVHINFPLWITINVILLQFTLCQAFKFFFHSEMQTHNTKFATKRWLSHTWSLLFFSPELTFGK